MVEHELAGTTLGDLSASDRPRPSCAHTSSEITRYATGTTGYAGDTEACVHMIAQACDNGLFDLHWLDRCPLIEAARVLPELVALRAVVAARADAVLDALYCDRTADTIV